MQTLEVVVILEMNKDFYRGGMVYQDEDPYMNYEPYKLTKTLTLRGPRPDFNNPYLCFVGAAQTFGRYCERPFPQIVCDHLKKGCLNMGFGGADPSYFLKDEILEYVNGSEIVFVQVFSSRSCSNSVFKNCGGTRHGSANGKYILADDFWQNCLKNYDFKRTFSLIQETRNQYVESMINLAKSINKKKYLLWFSYRNPEYSINFSSYFGMTNYFPHFVNLDMVNCIKPYFDGYIECVGMEGIPQKVNKSVINTYYPSPENHTKMSVKLIESLKKDIVKLYA